MNLLFNIQLKQAKSKAVNKQSRKQANKQSLIKMSNIKEKMSRYEVEVLL